MAALKYGVMDKPDRKVEPFRLKPIRLKAEDSLAMTEIIEKRLDGRIWRELSPTEMPKFVSRELITRNSDGSPRAVADLAHLSEHYKNISTKHETLEGFSASLLPEDYLISMDLKSGYHHFRLHPDMRQYFVVSVTLEDGTNRVFEYLVLPFGWSRSGYWFCRLVARFWNFVKKTYRYRVLSFVDDFGIAPSSGRASTSSDCAKASETLDRLCDRYGLTRHPNKGVWNAGTQRLHHLGFMIDTKLGLFGVPTAKLDAIASMARGLLSRARRNRRRVRAKNLESFIGKAQSLRLAVPETAFRLRALYDLVPKRSAERAIGIPSAYRYPRPRWATSAVLSHAALRDLQFWRDLPKSLHHRPIWPLEKAPTSTVHTDASLTAFGATLAHGAQEAGSRRFYEVQGYWDGEHRVKTNITILELMTVRLSLRQFLEHCVLRREDVVRLYTDNQVVMHTVQKWVSKSPTIMAELRRLHQLCYLHGLSLQLHYLPSALNLYADRLSRRRRVMDYLPRIQEVPDHWWLGDSEHDLRLNWREVELLRPPLEMLPLVPEKVKADGFPGLLLVPCWPRQNWYQALLGESRAHRVLEPDKGAGKKWRATLMVFSAAAERLARGLKCWPSLSEDGSRAASHPAREILVGWKKGPDL